MASSYLTPDLLRRDPVSERRPTLRPGVTTQHGDGGTQRGRSADGSWLLVLLPHTHATDGEGLSGHLTLGGKDGDWSGEPLDEDAQGRVAEQGGTKSPQLPVRGSALPGTALGQEMCAWGHTRQRMAGPVWPLPSLPVITDDIGSVLTAPHRCGRATYSPRPPG